MTNEFSHLPWRTGAGRDQPAPGSARPEVENARRFAAQYPDIAEWFARNRAVAEGGGTPFHFAMSLREQAIAKGHLSAAQIDAARRCINREATMRSIAGVPGLDGLHEAINKLSDSGVEWPALRFGEVKVTPAAKDPSTLYVKVSGRYVGSIRRGTYVPNSSGDDAGIAAESFASIAESGVEEALRMHGYEFGNCGVCGRTLSNDESVKLGIGPVCRERLFGG